MWGAALGAGISGVTSMITAAQNNKYAKQAAKRNYEYSLSYLRESPKQQRAGLEAAGYNPMLALGNIGSGTYQGTEQAAKMDTPDLVGGAKAAAKMVQDVMKGYKLQNEKTEKEIENLESDLATKETQRNQTAANTSLIEAQDKRQTLGLGVDVANTIGGIAGTAGGVYSATQGAKVSKEMAKRINRKGADVAPLVKGTPKAVPTNNAVPPMSRNSAQGAKQALGGLGLFGIPALIGGGAGYLEGKNKAREMKRGDHWDSKDKNNRKEKARKKWYLYHDIGF